MRSVNVAELRNRLSKYLRFAKGGEEIVIRDRNLPVAKLVPFSADEGTEEELLLVAAGKMRLPKTSVDVEELLRIPTGKFLFARGYRHCSMTGKNHYEQNRGFWGLKRISFLICPRGDQPARAGAVEEIHASGMVGESG
jgi:prevent-host-death family protein